MIERVKKAETVGQTRGLFQFGGETRKTKCGERRGMWEMMGGLQEDTGGLIIDKNND